MISRRGCAFLSRSMSAYAWPCLRLTSARPRVLPLDLLPFPMVLSLSCCNSSTSPVQSSTAFLHGRGIFHAICQRARSFRTDRTSVGVTTCTTRVRVRHYFRWVKDDKGRRNLGSTISRLHGRRIFHRASYKGEPTTSRRIRDRKFSDRVAATSSRIFQTSHVTDRKRV